VTQPLGIKDVYLGLPEKEFPRMAKMVVEEQVRQQQAQRARFSDFINTYDGIKLPLAWVGGVAKARDLANLMNVLAYEGAWRNRTFFSKQTLKLASTPTNAPGMTDLRLQQPIRWGLGFILGDTPNIYGTPPHPRAVGHAGGGAVVAWADPDQRLAVAFLCNRMVTRAGPQRNREIGDLIYGALKQANKKR
jgi:CubicO group peptidase (beta-lactamase class C family)